jgi:predicted Zn-dependent protease
MLRHPFRVTAIARAVALFLLPASFITPASAQTPAATPAGAGIFNPTTVPADARVHFMAALDAWRNWQSGAAVEHANRALAIDSTLGLPRAIRAWQIAGPTRGPEMSRAVGDAMRLGIGHATIALGMAYNAHLPTRQTLVRMFPGDRGLAFDLAMTYAGAARIDSLRALTVRFPDYVPAKVRLAYLLVPSGIAVIQPAAGEEALRVAQEALRLAPNTSTTHMIVGHVLERLYRHDDAMVHLRHATTMSPPHHWAYVLIGEIAMRDGKPPAEARAAFDSASRLVPNVSLKVDYARVASMMPMAGGNLRATLTALESLARDAEAAGLRADAAECYVWASHAAAGDRNNGATIERYIGEAARLGFAQPGLSNQALYAYGITGDGPRARRTLTAWTQLTQNNTTPARANTLEIMTGLTLLAEGKASEAIAVLAAVAENNATDRFIALGLIEAYKLAGRTADERAARDSLLARKDVRYLSTALPILRYRMATNR